MTKKQNKKNLKQKGVHKVQVEDKKEVEENDNARIETQNIDNKEQQKPKKEKPNQVNVKLILVKGKVAEKGLKSFLRCGVKFTNEYQELEVDKQTLARLQAEPKLTIQVVK